MTDQVETAEGNTLLVLAFEDLQFGRVEIIGSDGEQVTDEAMVLDALVLDREAERRFVLRLVLPSLVAEQFAAVAAFGDKGEGS